jgi:hypothetical protein
MSAELKNTPYIKICSAGLELLHEGSHSETSRRNFAVFFFFFCDRVKMHVKMLLQTGIAEK